MTLNVSNQREVALASPSMPNGLRHTELSVPGLRCAGCMSKAERALLAMPGVRGARANLSTKRVSVTWEDAETPPDIIGALQDIGQPAHVFETADDDDGDAEYTHLLKVVAIAGFSSMNIMMLSLSVWSGADVFSRQAFHLISAALALPAILYSGNIFYVSAWRAIRAGRTNMDVPISVGVLLAFAMSIYDTANGEAHVYFDAAASLVFFLLIGRVLDHRMRGKARSSIAGLRRLSPPGALVEQEDGDLEYWPIADIKPGCVFMVLPGERFPLDGVILDGASEIDRSLVTGESEPISVGPEVRVVAGALNLLAPLRVSAVADKNGSFLAAMERMMEAAQTGRSDYRRLADRASALYAPVVHLMALLAFVGWFFAFGDWHHALTIAVAVLIVTCPCALGLAVPIVQVVAAQRLFDKGIVLRDGAALERLAEVDSVIFDKTGVLTLAEISITNAAEIPEVALSTAASLARSSGHPVASAICRAASSASIQSDLLSEKAEIPGFGIEAIDQRGTRLRLGRASWAFSETTIPNGMEPTSCVLSRDGQLLARFALQQTARPDAKAAIGLLRDDGLHIEMLSGDSEPAVSSLATRLNISLSQSGLTPAEKFARISALQNSGHKVLMVGDGLNDLPAMAAAHTSMAPASAADISRNTADLVFMGEDLLAVPVAVRVARASDRLIKQNFALAIGYNVIAIPLALAGQVTPLIAAIAMSLSSVVVIGNALRLSAARTARVRSRSESYRWREQVAT